MYNTLPCAKKGGKTVDQSQKTVFGMCNFCMQSVHYNYPVVISSIFSAALCAASPRSFPLGFLTSTERTRRVIPTMHSPNNKSYMDILNFIRGKLLIGGC